MSLGRRYPCGNTICLCVPKCPRPSCAYCKTPVQVGDLCIRARASAHLGLCAISAAVTFIVLAEALRESCMAGGCRGSVFVGSVVIGDHAIARHLGVPR